MKNNTRQKIRRGLGLAAMLVAFIFMKASVQAASSLGLDIKVSINATKALTVGSTIYNFGVMNVNTSSVSASSILVTNTSGALVESYAITGANATSTSGGTTWTLAASTGAIDTYVLGAQFSTASPTNTDATWATSISSITLGNCTAAQFGNGTLAQSGSTVSPVGGSSTRNLWFRMITPVYVTDPSQRNATITLAVQ